MIVKTSYKISFLIIVLFVTSFIISACAEQTLPPPQVSRSTSIPSSAIKVSPSTDSLPPILHSSDYEKPIPLDSTINTAGAEDSAFITPDGNTLYFFFTPDVNIPPEKQLIDGITGIYVSNKSGNQWSPPVRIILQDNKDVALDGCIFVQGTEMWFCSARKGNYRGVDMWIANFKDGRWQDWKNAGSKLNIEYKIGEMHITADGNEIYFHSDKPGGKGGYDIWVSKKANGEWQAPENIETINSPDYDGWPFLTVDGNELWFTRFYLGSPAIFRATRSNNRQWSTPELVISQFAGEPSLDNGGNIYFTHHYYKDNKMIEADIYVAYRKK